MWLFQKHPSTRPTNGGLRQKKPAADWYGGRRNVTLLGRDPRILRDLLSLWVSTSVLSNKKNEPAGCDGAGSKKQGIVERYTEQAGLAYLILSRWARSVAMKFALSTEKEFEGPRNFKVLRSHLDLDGWHAMRPATE